uniref:AIG1-type G domain-containing protein n=1 Tax=Magallana gigas TaxID=29159 RepID=A0A8W8NYC4_MAGGI
MMAHFKNKKAGITPKPYRFSVYPVNKCPGSKTEFQRASQRMNCTKDLRYLCAPNKYLSSLIEFCTDRKRSLYGKEQVEKSKDNNENESLLKDNPEIDDDKLRQFLSKGEITVCHVRCNIVGCGKAGKTTLLKRLQNVSFEELMQIERTEMVDFHVNSFEVLLEEETIQNYYKFWLKSIDSFSDTESPVIIVGTHADKLSKEECHKFLKSLNELFDNWSHSGLRRHLNKDRMYTIGFPDSGSELEDLKDLKKCIANIVNCPRYSKENIRPVWALFEHILNKMKETEKVIPRKTLSDYSDQLSAQEFRIDESEISKMLVFFHRVGVLLYFDKDGLKEKIILDIQWLLDAFKCIIEYPVRTEENDMKRRHFCRTGELDSVELDRIWHIEGKDFLKHKTTIIAYMQQLGLLMPFKELHSIDSTVYYFPSMNSKRFDKTGENNSKSSILCFKFDDEMQLPSNAFQGIVLKCSELNNWSILTEGGKNNICLYQNAACFSFKNHVVVLFNCNFEIRVQVWALPNIYDAKLLVDVKYSVVRIIKEVELPSYEMGYKCRKDVLNVEEDVSFISQSKCPVSNHLCETCNGAKNDVDMEPKELLSSAENVKDNIGLIPFDKAGSKKSATKDTILGITGNGAKNDVDMEPKELLSSAENVKDNIRLILFDKAGSKKSATKYTILGITGMTWKTSPNKSSCSETSAVYSGKKIHIFDSSKFFDTTKSNEKIRREILECISITSPGPDAIIFVLNIAEGTAEEVKYMQHLVTIFGEKIYEHFIVLLTKTDYHDYKTKSVIPPLQTIFDKCENRVMEFDNKIKSNMRDDQLSTLLKKVSEVENKNGEWYRNEIYKIANELWKKTPLRRK